MKHLEPILYLTISSCLILFLFFIDEARFSLDGIFTLGGIVVFLMYLLPTFISQVVLSKIFSAYIKNTSVRMMLCFILGTLVGLTFTIALFSGALAIFMN